jgi:5-methylthioadenosine/S-adenosylhomocysteine deaminase
MGPLVSKEQQERVLSYIESGRKDGVSVVAGGDALDHPGYFVKPTVLASVRNDIKVVQEEIFGPVVVAQRFDDLNEIAALANDTTYGLSASIWSNDLTAVHRLVPKIKAGTVWVPMQWQRRDVLKAATALGIASFSRSAGAQADALAPQGEFLIRNGHVLTMDASRGDIDAGDVHVRDGAIVAVGEGLSAPGAELIDATDMLVLPGFVETHWHIWTTMLRSMSGDTAEYGYFPTSRGVGAFYVASDMYASARLALAEAITSGITFVHDWCHNVGTPEFAEQAIRALNEMGIRGRFSYGTPTGATGDQTIDQADFRRLHESWDTVSPDGRLDLGLAWRGAGSDASVSDYRLARELGRPVSVHVNNFQASAGGIASIADAGMLGPDVQLIHAIWSSPEEVAAVAESGAALSLSPYTELRIGFGFPMTGEYLAAGVPIGLSVDTPALSGNADMFAIMKVIQNVENARTLDEFKLPARRVLELATIEGARSMGVDDAVGSLVAGKRADLIMVDTRHVNLGVVTDPAHMLVEAAQPSNVDSVMIDGRWLKQGGMLTSVDVGEVVDEARAASDAVRRRADWW